MVAKKNIFEKLGLIEEIDEDQEENKKQDNDFDSENQEGIKSDSNEKKDLDKNSKSKKSDEKDFDSDEKNKEIDENNQAEVREMLNNKEIKSIDNNLNENKSKLEDKQEELQEEDISKKLDDFIDSYEKNKLLTIEDIYKNARLTLDSKKSIFIIDILSKTLPENLPVDVKRETVLSLMNVQGLEKEKLLNDAYNRIDALNTVLEDTVNKSEEIIERNKNSIRELEKRIEELKNINEERREFQNDQNTLIEYEIQKIINLVDFVKPKNDE